MTQLYMTDSLCSYCLLSHPITCSSMLQPILFFLLSFSYMRVFARPLVTQYARQYESSDLSSQNLPESTASSWTDASSTWQQASSAIDTTYDSNQPIETQYIQTITQSWSPSTTSDVTYQATSSSALYSDLPSSTSNPIGSNGQAGDQDTTYNQCLQIVNPNSPDLLDEMINSAGTLNADSKDTEIAKLAAVYIAVASIRPQWLLPRYYAYCEAQRNQPKLEGNWFTKARTDYTSGTDPWKAFIDNSDTTDYGSLEFQVNGQCTTERIQELFDFVDQSIANHRPLTIAWNKDLDLSPADYGAVTAAKAPGEGSPGHQLQIWPATGQQSSIPLSVEDLCKANARLSGPLGNYNPS